MNTQTFSLLLFLFSHALLPTLPAAAAEPEPPETPLEDLDPFIVTGTATPTRASEMIAPVNVLTGEALRFKAEGTLGGTLEGEPGLHSTSFGAGAGRPVIRGFEGPRVRVLESGLDSHDASEASPDHAVTLDPMFAETVEVLRGPATLLYGSSAIGGVVNVLDNRIPREAGERPASGAGEVRYDSAAEGWSSGVFGRVDGGPWSALVSGSWRDHGDYAIPGAAESEILHEAEGHEEHEEEEMTGRLENSWVQSRSGSAAVSWRPRPGVRWSVAVTGFETQYGVPGHAHEHEEEPPPGGAQEEEEGVSIDLEQRRLDLEGVVTLGDGFWRDVEFRFNAGDYTHSELEGDELGTRFDRESWESRVEAGHAWTPAVSGIFGAQGGRTDFEASGEEAFTPPSVTEDLALFALEEWRSAAVSLQAGLRWEQRKIEAEGHEPFEASAWSASVGGRWRFLPAWSVSVALAQAERLPTATELFADGPHAATRQYEVGDASLGKETSTGVDATLRLLEGPVTGQVTVFYNRFDDYIFGAETGAEEDGLPVFAFTAVEAEFTGVEGEAVWHVVHGPRHNLDIKAMGDVVRATETGGDVPLPRIPAARLGAGISYLIGSWHAGSTLRKVFEQDRTAPGELPTEGWWEWTAELAVHLESEGGAGKGILFLRGTNLLDEEIRPHTSYLKDLAPRPGRGVTAGLRWEF